MICCEIIITCAAVESHSGISQRKNWMSGLPNHYKAVVSHSARLFPDISQIYIFAWTCCISSIDASRVVSFLINCAGQVGRSLHVHRFRMNQNHCIYLSSCSHTFRQAFSTMMPCPWSMKYLRQYEPDV